jgi:predicted dehydrogenase
VSQSVETVERPLHLAFIGAGGVLSHQMRHLKPVPHVIPTAAADVSEGALAWAKEQFGIPNLFTDYRRMLKEADVDAVSVCTPNGVHAEHSIAALEAGKHVLVEKPMAMNARDARKMIDAAASSGKQLVVGFQHRFDPRAQMVRRQIESGSFGKILYVRAQALRRRGIPSWGVFGRKDLQGGGPLIDIGVHVLEAAHFLMGSPRPVTATAGTYCYLGDKPCAVETEWGPWDHKTYTVEDLAVGMIRFDGGATLTIETSFAAHVEHDVWRVQVMGEKGGADLRGTENFDSAHLFADHGGYMMNMTPARVGKMHPFEYKMRHFVDVARGVRTSEVPPEHGLVVQQMLDAVYESAGKGREVTIG